MRGPKLVACNIWNDWEGAIFPWSVNWVDFTLVLASAEWDKQFGNVEVHFAVLGCHFRLVVNISEGNTEFQKELEEMIKEWGRDD